MFLAGCFFFILLCENKGDHAHTAGRTTASGTHRVDYAGALRQQEAKQKKKYKQEALIKAFFIDFKSIFSGFGIV
jgi:hypothetical protein